MTILETDFGKLVAEMRNAQKEFVRTDSDQAREKAQRLEKKVDQALTDSQKELF